MHSLRRWLHRTSVKRLVLLTCAFTFIAFLLLHYLSFHLAQHHGHLAVQSYHVPRLRESAKVFNNQSSHHHRRRTTRVNISALMNQFDNEKVVHHVRNTPVDTKRCFNLPFMAPEPAVLEETFEWQVLEEDDASCYLFSAYYEPRTEPNAVRIIGMALEDEEEQRYCQLWYSNDTAPSVIQAELVPVPESHEREYSAVFYMCYLKHNQIPYAVSLVKSPCIHAEPHLRRYEAEGIVRIIPWNVPVAVDVWPPDPDITPKIHYFAQLVALNDCLYRNMFRSRLVVFSDLDEVIVPRIHDSWLAMLSAASSSWSDAFYSIDGRQVFHGAYLVQNTFFRLDWPNVAGDDVRIRNSKLLTLQKLRREQKIYQWYLRSKYIVWPSVATVVTVHSVFEFVDNKKVLEVRVENDLALVHHYRVWDGSGRIDEVSSVVDDRMLHFAEKLISHVSLRLKKFPQLVRASL